MARRTRAIRSRAPPRTRRWICSRPSRASQQVAAIETAMREGLKSAVGCPGSPTCASRARSAWCSSSADECDALRGASSVSASGCGRSATFYLMPPLVIDGSDLAQLIAATRRSQPLDCSGARRVRPVTYSVSSHGPRHILEAACRHAAIAMRGRPARIVRDHDDRLAVRAIEQLQQAEYRLRGLAV